jgi:uncharacterized protein (DUF1800 family)
MADNDLALMAHLLRRAGFGATREELDGYLAMGYEAAVEELLSPTAAPLPVDDAFLMRRYHVDVNSMMYNESGQAYWLHRMVNTRRPLEEKVALLWHQVFATSAGKINQPKLVIQQIDTFRRYGLGRFDGLLVQVSKDPAMLYWLDNKDSHKDAPNENYGRELLELFSMGVGNYTEQDVFECSRSFTGWTIAAKIPRLPLGRFPWEFEYKPEDHDDGEKTFLGHKGNFNGDDIIDIIVRQPATSRFIARHLYNFFVADEEQVPAWQHNPPKDPAAINIIGDVFMTSGYDMRRTLRVLFNSDFFKAESARFAKVKSPTEVVVGTMNLVGDFKGAPKPGLMALGMEPTNMGQSLLDPPSVEGWHTGAEWIDSGSLVRRINFVADRVGDLSLPGVRDIVDRVRAQGNISPEELVDTCIDLIGPTQVSKMTREELLTQARSGGDVSWDSQQAPDSSTQRVLEMLQLIAASREYQFG